jgi:hypothetical protein
VGHVHSGLAPLFGGTLDLAGSKAWIEHKVRLRSIASKAPEGDIEITSWARRLKAAKFILQDGAAPVSVDMSSLRDNVTIKIPLTGGSTELIDGGFTGNPTEIAVDHFVLPTIELNAATVDIGTLASLATLVDFIAPDAFCANV